MFTDSYTLGPNGQLIRKGDRSKQRPRCGMCGRPIRTMLPGTPVPSSVLLCRECHSRGVHTKAFYDDQKSIRARRRR
ncbi:MAG: hypothetical protein RUDDFDWM_000075 [Candidatus Fervidibacterota bacterium]